MSLKQHNDIVEKLLAQIDSKDSQISNLKKQLHKASGLHNDHTKTRVEDTEKLANRKVALLHKEYKEKVNTLHNQIRNRSLENKELKERLNKLRNLEAKQKDHISEVMKKTAQHSSSDPKFAAMVSHYEAQLQRKDKHIASLQKQLKENFHQLGQKQAQLTSPILNQEEDDECIHPNIVEQKRVRPDQGSKYQRQLYSLQADYFKQKKLLEEKSKEFKDLTRKYSDLTKQYYRLLNEFGQEAPARATQPLNSGTRAQRETSGGNISEGTHQSLDDSSVVHCSLSYSETSDLRSAFQAKNPAAQDSGQAEASAELLSQVMQILEVDSRVLVISALTRIKAKSACLVDYQTMSKSLQSMLNRLGMGEVPMSGLLKGMERMEQKIVKMAESCDLLDQICIEVGAKKQRVMEKINDFKAMQDQLFKNLRDVGFMQKLPKANKIIEFIEYFELDREVCELPEQLRRMYEQIKYVDRFIKQAQLILKKEPSSLEKSMESILRYLERKEAEESFLQKEKPKRKQIGHQ